jgi:hypothetical protein
MLLPFCCRQVRDPREARLVIHGWFTSPEPHFEGTLTEEQATAGLAPHLSAIAMALAPPRVTGLLALRIDVAADGAVTSIRRLADTLVADPAALFDRSGVAPPLDAPAARRAVLETIESNLCAATFPVSDGTSTITIPFTFD